MSQCPDCGSDMLTGGCSNWTCSSRTGTVSYVVSREPVIPLELWISSTGLKNFSEYCVKDNLIAYGITGTLSQELTQAIMTSLRKELEIAGWNPPAQFVFEVDTQSASMSEVKSKKAVLVVQDGEKVKFVCGCGREMKLAVDKE